MAVSDVPLKMSVFEQSVLRKNVDPCQTAILRSFYMRLLTNYRIVHTKLSI